MLLPDDQTDARLSFSDVLEALGARPEPKLTLQELVAAFGERGFGAMILVLSLLALLPWPPGGKAVFAIPIILMSLELAFQRRSVWLPRWMLRASLSRSAYANLLTRPIEAPMWARRFVIRTRVHIGSHVYGFSDWVRRLARKRPNGASLLNLVRGVERLTRPRLPFLTGEVADTITGLVCVLMAVVMALPIPFGDTLPGLALVLFALGMMQRDGLAVLLGAAMTGVCSLYLFLIWRTVLEIGQHLAGWVASLFG